MVANFDERLTTAKTKICDMCILVMAILSVPVAGLALSRLPEMGWQLPWGAHLIVVGLFPILLFYKNRLSLERKGRLFCGALFLLGSIEVLKWGLFSVGPLGLALSCAMASVFLTKADAFASFIAGVVVLLLAGLSFSTPAEVITAPYIAAQDTWTLYVFCFAIVTGLIVFGISKYNAFLIMQLEEIPANGNEFQGSSGNLEQIVADKTREVAESETNYKALVEGSLQGILVLCDNKPVFANQATVAIYGFDRVEDVLDIPSIDTLVTPEEQERMSEVRNKRLTDGDFKSVFEFFGRKRDGSRIRLQATGRRIIWQGKTAIQSTIIDITEQYKANIEQQLATQRLEDFAKSSSDWFWEMDADLRFTSTSRRDVATPIVSELRAVGKTRWELMGGDTETDPLWREHKVTLEAQLPFRDFVVPAKRINGEAAFININGVPVFDANGQFQGYRGTSSDVTERIKSEEIKNNFLSTVSHELRTPLTSIRGAAGLIGAGATGEISSEAKELLGMIDQNSKRLAGLIDDIMDAEKLESGKFGFQIAPVLLSSFMRRVFDEYLGVAEYYDVTLVRAIDLPDISIESDENRLMQVFANLISNAAKFSAAGQSIVLNCEDRGDIVRFSVKDDGSGIPQEFRDHIFNKFTQADSSATRSIGGTGLGLSISKQIVENLDGKIGFESTPNVGSTFFFDMPAATTKNLN